MNEGTNVTVSFKNNVSGMTKLEKYQEKLTKLKELLEGMPNTYKVETTSSLSKTDKEIDKVNNKLEKSKTLIKEGFNAATFLAFAKAIKNSIATMSNYTSKVADYVENINLMNVAFHRSKDSMEDASLAGTKFVNTLSEMYGLDESNLTRTVGIFKQLANAMNLSDEVGTKLATTLTKLSIDTASLYNLSFERASSVLQSALAGQTKPVRSAFGADITETTLQVTLDTYGIDKTVRDLTYAEKRLIIVTSLLNQLTESQNDYGKTVESVANQMRVYDEQVQRLSRAIGSVFMPLLQKILPYLNAILMVLTEIISTFAVFLGFDEDMFAGFASGDVTADIWDMDEALGSAGNSAKKLKQGLRGFDKLNVISTQKDTSSGGVGVGGVDSDILNAFNKEMEEYDKRLKEIKTKATDIRDKIMEWLGFTKEVDDETGKVSFKFDHITGGTVLGALAVGGTIFIGVSRIYNLLNKIGLLKFTNITALGSVFSGVGSFLGNTTAFQTLAGYVDDIAIGIGGWATGAWSFKEAWSLISPALSKIGIWALVIARIVELVGSIVKWIEAIINLIKDPSWENFFKISEEGLKSTGILGNIVLGIFNSFGVNAETAGKAMEDFGTKVEEAVKPLSDAFNKNVIEPLEKIKKFGSETFDRIKEKFDEVSGKLGEIKDAWVRWWEDDIKPKVFNKIKEKIDEFKGWLNELGKKFETFYDEHVKDTFVGKMISGIGNTIANIKTEFAKMVEGIKNQFTKISNWLRDNFFPKLLFGALKTGLNPIITKIENFLNKGIKRINGLIVATNKITNSDISPIGDLELPRFKTGIDFVPNDFFGPVYLDYGERVLTKEQNQDYTKGLSGAGNTGMKGQIFSPTIVVQVGSKEVAREVLNELNDMAMANGSEIVIGG